MPAHAVADELVVGTEYSLRFAAPEVAVAGYAFVLTQALVQVHPFAAKAQTALALRFLRWRRLFCQLMQIELAHDSAPSS
jgi:hypothetical protein